MLTACQPLMRAERQPQAHASRCLCPRRGQLGHMAGSSIHLGGPAPDSSSLSLKDTGPSGAVSPAY